VKVLVVHNRYRSDLPSGENRVVDTEMAALAEAGVEVLPYVRSSDEITAMPLHSKLSVPLMPLHSPQAVRDVKHIISRTHPDLLHLHNPYPLISWSVVRVAKDRGIPVVQTLHNHRHSCMRGSYFRDGHPCFECRGKPLPWPAVRHGCYRDSRAQSLPMTFAFLAHRGDQRSVDRYIALTQPIAESILASGLALPHQVVVRANTVPDPGPCADSGEGLLFVGRLSVEKGLPLLLESWDAAGRPFPSLTVVGDGPLRSLVEERASDTSSRIRFIGPTDAAGVSQAMTECAVLVVPSVSPEGLPLVVLEAFAHGKPVLATTGGGLGATVDAAVGWLTAPDVEALASALRAAKDGVAARGPEARRRFERLYSPKAVITQQLELYRSVIEEPRGQAL
jgi:glycosyltransferase involved in cell wall biosynthesis